MGTDRSELERLALGRDHALDNAVISRENELSTVVKELEHVLLDRRDVASSKHTEQLIITDEEKARECVALGLEVVCQRLLALVQRARHLGEYAYAALGQAGVVRVGVFGRVCHDLQPGLVQLVKLLGCFRELQNEREGGSLL